MAEESATVPLEQSTLEQGCGLQTSKLGLYGSHAICNFCMPPGNAEINDISIISKMVSLQTVKINDTKVTTLAPLASLHSMHELDASNNQLTQVLDFDTPDGTLEDQTLDVSNCYIGPVLQRANLSRNNIFHIRDLQLFMALSYLDLSNNKIQKITGVENLENLKTLKLVDNCLKSCEGVPPMIENLDLSGNAISDISPLASLVGLRDIALDQNRIGDLGPLSDCMWLNSVSAKENWIVRFDALLPLSSLELLRVVSFAGNPIENLSHYRSRILLRLPDVVQLDGAQASYGEKVRAKCIVGEELKVRRAHHEEFLPPALFYDPSPPFLESTEPKALSPRDKISLASQKVVESVITEAVDNQNPRQNGV